jgi:hypothetical protein
MEKKIATKMRKWEGEMKPYVAEREREPSTHAHGLYIGSRQCGK